MTSLWRRFFVAIPALAGAAFCGEVAYAQAVPVIGARNVTAGESDGVAEFVVRLSAPSTQNVSLRYDTDSASASSGSDFSGLGSTILTFAPGQISKAVRVALVDNTLAESAESFYLNLATPTNAVIGTETVTATIIDNDGPIGVPTIYISDPVLDEKATLAVFDVLLSRPATSTVTVDYNSVPGSAAVPDFSNVSGQLTFLPGQMRKLVAVPVQDDAIAENTETFHLALASPSNAILPDPRGTARIWRNDQPAIALPTVNVDHAAGGEASGFLELLVRLSAPSTQIVSVRYDTDSASASSGSDYSGLGSTSMAFAPGETARAIRVALVDGTSAESTESFYLNLATPSNALIGTGSALATIVDNDAASATATIVIADAVVDETGGNAVFDLKLDRAAVSNVTLKFGTANGSAGAPDFAGRKGDVVFVPGETAKSVAIPILDDATAEITETFDLILSAAVNAILPDALGRARIWQSDQPTVAIPTVSASGITVNEAAGFAELVVRLSAPSTQSISLRYDTDSGSASSGSDYSGLGSTTLTFAPGENAKPVRVGLVDNTLVESTETFYIKLTNATNAVIGTGSVTVTIVDND